MTAIDRATRRVSLSIKAREVDEEKRAIFGSSDSGASLGDILGAAISRARREDAAQTPSKEGEEKS